MVKQLKNIKKAWATLPRRVKKVFVTSAAVLVVACIVIVRSMSGGESAVIGVEANTSLGQSANYSSSVNSATEDSADVNIGFSERQEIKKREEERLVSSKAGGKTYLPDHSKLEMDTSEQESFFTSSEVAESKPEEKPEPSSLEEQFEAEIQQEKENKQNNNVRLRDEDFQAAVQARVSMYAAIVQKSKSVSPITAMKVRLYQPAGGAGNDSVKPDAPAVASDGTSISAKEGGLLPGDVILVKLDNYVNTDEAGSWMRLTVVDGPLEGARIMATYSRENGVVVAQTSTISWKGHTGPLSGVVVTADGKMKEGLSTDTDYHTLYRWGLLAFSGALKGAGEVYLQTSNEVITDNGNIIKVNERKPEDILIGMAKGLGDQLATVTAREFDTPPTVVVDPREVGILGIMINSQADHAWFPLISRSDVY